MTRWLIAGMLAATFAGGAAAQDTPPMAGQAPPPGPPRGGGGGGGMGMGLFRMADRNGDGVVTRDEYLAAVDAQFDREDLNHDGILQAGERPMRRGAVMGGPGAPPPMRGGDPGATGAPPPPPPRPMRDITRAQYREMALRRFDRLDANHDGKVDQQEMQSAMMMTRFRGARGGPGAMGNDLPAPPTAPPAQ